MPIPAADALAPEQAADAPAYPAPKTDTYDSPWKEAIEHHFPEFLLFYFPQVHALVDWQHAPVFLNQELQATARDAQSGKRYVDKLVRVTVQSGQALCLYIHLEIQGARQRIFPERMFVYHYRIFDRYRAPVVSLAVLADRSAAWQPRHFGYAYAGCSLRLDFPVAKLLDWQDRQAELQAHDNPFALVTLAHLLTQATRRNMPARLQAKWQLVQLLYRKGWTRQQVLDMLHMLDWMMRLPPHLNEQLWQNVAEFPEEKKMSYMTSFEKIAAAKGMEQGMAKGLEKGLEKGRQQSKAEDLQHLLQKRFGPLPADLQEKISIAPIDQLSLWFDRAIDVPSLAAVFQPIQH